MFVPLISRRSTSGKLGRRTDGTEDKIRLGGGGRGGGGGGGGGGGRGGSSGSSGGGRGGSTGGVTGGGSRGGGGGRGGSGISTNSGGGGSTPAVISGRGGGPVVTIPNGQPFGGRSAGGGTRGQIFGTSQYGSGYPGLIGRGTAGRGFPFYFWPVVWGGVAGAGAAAYLGPSEYGSPSNASRPGGPLATAAFQSNTLNTTFRILSDNMTVADLIDGIMDQCSTELQPSNITATMYNDSVPLPKPAQAIQYYRASSIVLTLDGYNNSATLGGDNATNTPLPSNIDTTLLNCINITIGNMAPLVNSASGNGVPMVRMASNSGLFGLVWIVLMLLYLA